MVNDLLRDNTRVKSLDLRGCNIRSDGASALASLLSHNRTLTFLGLEWNGVGMLETGVQSLCKALASNPSIAEVDLRNNSIGPTGGAALGAMLATNTAIRRLDLRWNNLGVHGGRALAESLEKNRHIKELEVSGNKLTEDAVRHIDSLLQRNRGEGAGPPAGSERALGPAPASAAASPGKTAAETGRGSAGRVVVHAPLGAESAAADRSRGDVTKSHGEPLEQTMRAKLLELSQALLDSKEKSVAMERALTEEQRLRADGEVRLRECESVIQELQARIDTTMQSMQGGQRQLTDNLNQVHCGRAGLSSLRGGYASFLMSFAPWVGRNVISVWSRRSETTRCNSRFLVLCVCVCVCLCVCVCVCVCVCILCVCRQVRTPARCVQGGNVPCKTCTAASLGSTLMMLRSRCLRGTRAADGPAAGRVAQCHRQGRAHQAWFRDRGRERCQGVDGLCQRLRAACRFCIRAGVSNTLVHGEWEHILTAWQSR